MCPHQSPCPIADRLDHGAAHTMVFNLEQGQSLTWARSCLAAGCLPRTSGFPPGREKTSKGCLWWIRSDP
jgi:hypothetical protein